MDTRSPINFTTKFPAVSKNTPLYGTLQTAERVISLLLEYADSVDNKFQYFIGNDPIDIPDVYYFGQVPIYFIPGWGAYTIGKGEKSIMLKLPEGPEDLLSDVETATKYIGKLNNQNARESEQRRIRASWQRNMTKKARIR